MKNLFIAHVRPIIDYCSSVWNTGYIQDLKILESVQRHFTKQINGLSRFSYADRLKFLNLFSIRGRLIRSDLIKYWKIFHNHSSIKHNDLFTLAPTSNLRGHEYKIFVQHTNTDIRKRFFSVRCIPLWNNLSHNTVQSTSLDSFKAAIGNELGPLLFTYNS